MTGTERGIEQRFKESVEGQVDLLRLEATIRYWGNVALDRQISNEDQVTIFSRIRGFVNHENDRISFAVRGILQEGWDRVHLYQTFSSSLSLGQEKEHLMELMEFDSSFNETAKSALLLLSKAKTNGADLTVELLQRELVLIHGPEVDLDGAWKQLNELYVLDERGSLERVAYANELDVSLSDKAFLALEPHLAVLDAISGREKKLSEEDLARMRIVKQILEDLRMDSINRINVLGPKIFYNSVVNGGFFGGISMIKSEIELSDSMDIKEGAFSDRENLVVPYLVLNGLYLLSARGGNYYNGHDEELRLELYDATSRLVSDYWGRLVTGKRIGELELHNRNAKVTDALIPTLLLGSLGESAADIYEVDISPSQLKMSGAVYFLDQIPIEFNYSKASGLTSGLYGEKSIISPDLSSIKIEIKNVEAYEENVTPKDGGYMRKHKTVEISPNDSGELKDLPSDGGNFDLSWEIEEERIKLVFHSSEEEYEETVYVDRTVSPEAFANYIHKTVSGTVTVTSDNKEKISQDVTSKINYIETEVSVSDNLQKRLVKALGLSEAILLDAYNTGASEKI